MDAEIPEDIKEAARRVVERGYNEGLIDAVEKALLVERERCACVAARHNGRSPKDARDIAAAIRKP